MYRFSLWNDTMPSLLRLLFLLLLNIFCVIHWYSPVVVAFPKAFTFELPDRRRLCFYEDISKSARYIISYRVIRGGANDVDVKVLNPNKAEIYQRQKSHKDSYNFEASTPGRYSFCFSNEFSTISHKLVFFELRPEKFETLNEEAGITKPTAFTMSEATLENMHSILSQVEEYQTDFKVREAEGRALSEELNERVLFWSCLIAVAILVIGLGQVTILKAFFTDKQGVGLRMAPQTKFQIPT